MNIFFCIYFGIFPTWRSSGAGGGTAWFFKGVNLVTMLSLQLWRTHLRTKKHLLLCQKLFFNDISYLDDGVYNQVKEKLVLTVFGPARASTTLLATASKQPSASSFCSSRLFYYYLISNTGICIKMKTTILILGI